MAQRILKIEGNIWYEGGPRNLSKQIFPAPNYFPPLYFEVSICRPLWDSLCTAQRYFFFNLSCRPSAFWGYPGGRPTWRFFFLYTRRQQNKNYTTYNIQPPPKDLQKSVLESANPRMDSECASGCPWSTARATAPSPGRPTPGVVKQDKSSGGSGDTTKTRSGPQRVRTSSGERPMGAAKGNQSDTEALCQPPPPPKWC